MCGRRRFRVCRVGCETAAQAKRVLTAVLRLHLLEDHCGRLGARQRECIRRSAWHERATLPRR